MILPFLPAHIAQRIPVRYEAAPLAILMEAQRISEDLGLPMSRALALVSELDHPKFVLEVRG